MSSELPSDVWVWFSVIEGSGPRGFDAGDVVDFDVEEADQDSCRYRATRAAFVRHGPAPELRRTGDQVIVVDPGTPKHPAPPPAKARTVLEQRLAAAAAPPSHLPARETAN